ncbi:MAG TPA: hypothetical protein ENH05_02760 [Rhizobiales bacterium]|nr:hypothetical protein [Hyphomicrobiales bacterium]
MDDYTWPQACDPEASKELAHALGVLTINWNNCEWMLDFILFDFIATDGRAGVFITGLMNNRSKCDLLAAIVYELDAPLTENCIQHYIKFFNICRENRNLIMHSTLDSIGTYGELSLVQTKYSSVLVEKALPVTAENLVERIKETQTLYDFTCAISNYLQTCQSGKPGPLPDQPPLPCRLTTTLPRHTIVSNPPESSPA